MQALTSSSFVFEGEVIDLEIGSILTALSYRVEKNRSAAIEGTADTISSLYLRNMTHVDSPVRSSRDPVAATVRVSKVWKGALRDTVTIHTARSSTSCGVGFKKNERYLIYASGSESHWVTNSCSRSARMSGAEKDLRALRQHLGAPIHVISSDTTTTREN